MADPHDPTFIETQFPVSKLSKESYKERKANYSQTLTGLGKWWGRKPLIMVRAAILGLLMPASGDPKKDREIFLKILTMDEAGLWQRKSKSIPLREVYARITLDEQAEFFGWDADPERPRFKKGLAKDRKERAQALVFGRMNYDEKLEYCDRPEQIEGPSGHAWEDINAHLGTEATSLPELVRQLGERRFGHVPRVGDAFCGGGSVPFEAARIGCEAYGSDLNPVAALLTWGALHIVGGGAEVARQVREAQEQVFAAVDRQVTAWGIEHNEAGWRADAYLYCTETRCPECGWSVPLAPSWVIGEKTRTIARLVPNHDGRRFEIEILQGVSAGDMAEAKRAGTVQDSRLHCPHCEASSPMSVIRKLPSPSGRGVGGEGLRLWENEDVLPRPDDVFQERLYCIRWVEAWLDDEGKEQRARYYRSPQKADLEREAKVLDLLRERFAEWQAKGYIPSRRIEPGGKTDEPIRTRGWTHWHHLFTPRQLLVHGLLLKVAKELSQTHQGAKGEGANAIGVAGLFGVGRCADYNAKLSRWHPHGANEKSEQVFSNQALNTLDSFASRAMQGLSSAWFLKPPNESLCHADLIRVADIRSISSTSDIWITDPPYADAINYHELSEFFLAWYEKHLPRLFPDWYADSKRALAIRGSGREFRQGMVDAYGNLARHMPDNGLQVVMFTHQDAGVWADLALILWAAGLRVTAAWTIGTETESALKEGNYVQGTVLMVLRKQTSEDVAFLHEIVPQVESEVENQLKSMLALEDREDPNFTDADYQLAAYAAALRALTQYRGIEDIDVGYELSRERARGEVSPIATMIEDAVKTASNFLVPAGVEGHLWKKLTAVEKFYLKGLEVESHGDFRSGVYQEFARGFGVRDYQFLLESGKANQTRLKTASELKRRELGGEGFGVSLLRQALFAVYRVAESEETREGLTWLKTEMKDYWAQRESVKNLLEYLSRLPMEHWVDDAAAARLLAGAVNNDHV
jgi:adenine-specific DNA methylase